MMSLPGLEPQWVTKTTMQDPLADQVESNIKTVSQVVDLTLEDALAEAEQIFSNPQASADELREAGQRVIRLTAAAQAATQSIQNLQEGTKAETAIAEAALTSPDETTFKTTTDKWAEEAAQYFERSQSQIKKAARAVGADQGFDGALSKVFPNSNVQERANSFWGVVGAAILGLDAMIDRAKTFPQRLWTNVQAFGSDRKAAVETTITQWGQRANQEWAALQQGLKDVSDRATQAAYFGVDALGAAVDTGRAVAIRANTSAEQFVDSKIVSPLVNFVVNLALPKIREWSQSLRDQVVDIKTQSVEQGHQLAVDFQESLAARRAQRQASEPNSEPTSSAPTL